MFSTPSAPHQRACANGRSTLIVYAATASPSSAMRALSVFVSSEHTGVSSDGTALTSRGFRGRSGHVTGNIPRSGAKPCTTKSRACSPGARRLADEVERVAEERDGRHARRVY